MELSTGPRLAMGGEAIARAPDGRVVFVEAAAPEERVEVEILEDKRRHLRARALRVIEPGRARVAPRCAHFGACGGCALQHVDVEVQRVKKGEAFAELLARLGRLEPGSFAIEAPWGGAPYAYRARARLAFEGGRLGYRARSSRRLVAAHECPVLVPELEDALRRAEVDPRARGELALSWDAGALSMWCEPEGAVRIEGALVTREAGAFRQANPAGNAALTAELLTRGRFDGRVLELYAGRGNFTRHLASRASRLVAVEGDREAAREAREALGPGVEVLAEPAERALERLVRRGDRFDAALADPPRAGLAEGAAEGLAGLGVAELWMVSCDPATFARDAGRLATQGLRLAWVRLFDFYPQTGHAEVLGRFLSAGQSASRGST